LFPRPELIARGIDVVDVERGGDVTYHGPGQLVFYPIRRLERFREVVPLVEALEEVAIRTCAAYGVQAERRREHHGVYVGADQIAAVGLTVKQMTSMHGIALNVTLELDFVRYVRPCGIAGQGVTSLAITAPGPDVMHRSRAAISASAASVFGLNFCEE